MGCTEIELLVQQSHVPEVVVIDSAALHIAAAIAVQAWPARGPSHATRTKFSSAPHHLVYWPCNLPRWMMAAAGARGRRR